MPLSDAGASWYKVATRGQFDRTNPFMRFIAAWISFNALYEELLPSKLEKTQIENIASDPTFQNHHRTLLGHNIYAAAVRVLGSSGVRDVRTGRRRNIDNSFSLQSVLNCTYQVRCNLFHGGKNTDNERDFILCAAGFVVIGNLLSHHQNGEIINEFGDLLL